MRTHNFILTTIRLLCLGLIGAANAEPAAAAAVLEASPVIHDDGCRECSMSLPSTIDSDGMVRVVSQLLANGELAEANLSDTPASLPEQAPAPYGTSLPPLAAAQAQHTGASVWFAVSFEDGSEPSMVHYPGVIIEGSRVAFETSGNHIPMGGTLYGPVVFDGLLRAHSATVIALEAGNKITAPDILDGDNTYQTSRIGLAQLTSEEAASLPYVRIARHTNTAELTNASIIHHFRGLYTALPVVNTRGELLGFQNTPPPETRHMVRDRETNISSQIRPAQVLLDMYQPEIPARRRLTHRIFLRPIQTCRSDGTKPANPQREVLEESTARIFAQAGVEVVWLPWVTWRNDDAWNGLFDGDHDVEAVLEDAPLYPEKFVINVIFNRNISTTRRIGGMSQTPGNVLFIAEWALTEANVQHVIAHEICHALGLGHTDFGADNQTNNVMHGIEPTDINDIYPYGAGLSRLTQEQIDHIRNRNERAPVIQSE